MRRYIVIALGCLSAVCLLDVRPAHAVPAFARREGVRCQMCHFRMPELNEDGYAYIRRGLREEPEEMSGMKMEKEKEEARIQARPASVFHPLGEPLYLQWADYLSIMGHHTFVIERGEKAKFDAGEIDIWAGGPFDPRWSALINPFFDIENGGADVEQGYGQYITRWAERFGSARFGQTQPFAIFFNQGGPSMALSTPVVLSTPGDTGTSWTPTSLLRGIEIGAIDMPRWNVYFGVGQPNLEETREPGAERHTDICASGEWLFSPIGNSLTAYGYWGHAQVSPTATNRTFHRIGIFGNIYLFRTKGVAGYLTGSDDAADGSSLDNSGYFLLVEHLLSDRWAAYARYDHFRRDLEAGGSQTISGPALGVSWWAWTPIRLTLETQLLSITGEHQSRALMLEFLWIY